ncbi:MAG: haloacid dehalogenase-like hydrolase [Betaproteobacteria bacterium]|nr:haloacid dehalogenase-like hydrolase [Betaproteobacteria bacterium]
MRDRAHLPRRAASLAVAAFACGLVATLAAAQPLPSWNDGPAKRAIVRFVADATTPGTPSFVPPADRIAVFDNDGTLWSEQPMYFQLAFAIDRVRALAPQHPEWKDTQPFKTALDGDMKALAASGEHGLLELVMATHAGNTSESSRGIVRDWARTARHPTIGRPYTELVYAPMRELLDYLRANGFQTFIVSGGGVEFLRVFAEELYGVPPEQVIGSGIKAKYEVRDGGPVIVRLPEIDFIDDKAGKPVGIHKFIGRRPIAAFGNSDGDVEMLEWTTTAPGPRLGVLVHHDDAGREFAYDRTSPFGKLDRGLDEARTRGWVVVSIGNDWRTVHAPAR